MPEPAAAWRCPEEYADNLLCFRALFTAGERQRRWSADHDSLRVLRQRDLVRGAGERAGAVPCAVRYGGGTVRVEHIEGQVRRPERTGRDCPGECRIGDKPTRISVLGDTQIEFNGVRLEQLPLLGVPLDEVSRTYGTAIDGIIGYDLMAMYVVKIDFDRRELTPYFYWTSRTPGRSCLRRRSSRNTIC